MPEPTAILALVKFAFPHYPDETRLSRMISLSLSLSLSPPPTPEVQHPKRLCIACSAPLERVSTVTGCRSESAVTECRYRVPLQSTVTEYRSESAVTEYRYRVRRYRVPLQSTHRYRVRIQKTDQSTVESDSALLPSPLYPPVHLGKVRRAM